MGKLKGPKPVRTFYIHPDGGWIHLRVFIWKTKNDMYVALPDKGPYVFAAISCGGDRYVEVKRNGRTRYQFCGEIGQLHFHEDQVRTGIITHECCHGAHTYFRYRKRFDPIVILDSTRNYGRRSVKDTEEAFCWVMGNMVREFFCRLDKRRGKLTCSPSWFRPVRFRKLYWNKRS